jgi:hypothetical protein
LPSLLEFGFEFVKMMDGITREAKMCDLTICHAGRSRNHTVLLCEGCHPLSWQIPSKLATAIMHIFVNKQLWTPLPTSNFPPRFKPDLNHKLLQLYPTAC